MKVKVLGKQGVDYISRRTNQQVLGVTLHCAQEQSNVEGLAVDTIFVSAKSSFYEDCNKLPVGCELEVGYNRYGSVETIRLCK